MHSIRKKWDIETAPKYTTLLWFSGVQWMLGSAWVSIPLDAVMVPPEVGCSGGARWALTRPCCFISWVTLHLHFQPQFPSLLKEVNGYASPCVCAGLRVRLLPGRFQEARL